MRTIRFGTQVSVLAILVVLSPALAMTAAAQVRHGGGGGGAPHIGGGGGGAPHFGGGGGGAPHFGGGAPHMSAPAPHFSAPHMAAPAPHFSAPAPRMSAAPHFAPHAAPHMASPRFNPSHVNSSRAARPNVPSHVARPNVGPSHGNTPSLARGRHGAHGPAIAHGNAGPHATPNAATPNAGATARDRLHDRLHDRQLGRGNAANERQLDRGNRANLANPNLGKPNLANKPGTAAPSTVGQGPAGHNLAGGLRNNSHQAGQSRILRNSSLATLAPNNAASRALTRSTFRGRFAQSDWAHDRGRDRDRDHRRHHLGFVLGFAGGLFWPYAYDDFVDYTFWPSAYDTFWPYAYDDVYEGLYGAYAPQYDEDYVYAGAPASSRTYASIGTPNARGGGTRGGGGVRGGATASQICSGEAQGLTDFPIERISQQVQPTQDQQALLDDLKAATQKAVQIMQDACPSDLPSTPTGRLAAMRIRVAAMLQAVETVRPALDKFYDALSDEQKERFNALDQSGTGNATTAGQNGGRSNQDISQLCGGQKSPVGNLPVDRIRDSLRLSDAQNADLQELDQASAKANDILNASCPTEQALTPTGRVAAMEQRLKAMQQAIETVRPALTKFYGSLNDEQKARFDRLGARPT